MDDASCVLKGCVLRVDAIGMSTSTSVGLEGRPSATAKPAAPRYQALDPLRACAALSVIAYHVSQACALAFSYGIVSSALALLKVGVTVFFVISGFVLYLPCARAIRDARPLPGWRHYARRRALRILPAYWLALAVCIPTGLGTIRAALAINHGSDWWRYLSLTQAYKASTVLGGLPVAWSLCVEFAFYIVLPFLARGVARLVAAQRRIAPSTVQLACLGAMAGASLLFRSTLTANLSSPVSRSQIVAATSLAALFDWFAIGMALAVLAAEWETGATVYAFVRGLAQHAWLCRLTAAALFAKVVSARWGDVFLPAYGLAAHMMLGAAAAFFVLPALRARSTSLREGPVRTASRRAFVWLGTVSYGVFLWQLPILQLIHGSLVPDLRHPATGLQYAGLFSAVVVGAVLLGAASWYLIEQPLQRRRIHKPAPAQPSPPPIMMRRAASQSSSSEVMSRLAG
jgi:peptidoglycan/LPS O-acetylase OafA/YrhL